MTTVDNSALPSAIPASVLGKILRIRELSPNSRAGCGAKECKNFADYKITFELPVMLSHVKVCALHKNAIVKRESDSQKR